MKLNSHLSRRAFTGALAFAAVAKADMGVDIQSVETISPQPEHFHGWPTLAIRANGELLAVSSGGREAHVCPFGRVELMRSTDGGKTWSWPEVLMDSAIDDRDAGLCVTDKGTILVTTFTSLAFQKTLKDASGWPADRLARWNAVSRRGSQPQFENLLGTWMLRSEDGGMTWSQPYRVLVNSPHGPSAVSGGRLLYAGKQLWSGGGKIGVCESKDDGRSWKWLAEIPARPGDTVSDYHELHQVETADGGLVVHIRNHSKQNERETLQTESSDGGKTWSVPHPIGVWGLPSQLARLRSGVLVMSYGYRRAPRGNHARISRDGGRSWSEPLVLSTDGSGDIGYPSTVELPDGMLATLWYEATKDAPRASLRLARWKLKN